jgi:hypothetical protein
VVEREALPREVEAALVVVEREQDDHEDREEQVEQRQHRPDAEQPPARAVGTARGRRARLGDALDRARGGG